MPKLEDKHKIGLGFTPEVAEGYGQVYMLFSQTGIIFGQDGVRFDLQNRENIGVSGLYYETLSADKCKSMKEHFKLHVEAKNGPLDS